MKITLQNIGKRYNNDWIFRKMNFQFEQKKKYVILGPNGSGKSTLLQVIAGNILSSEGTIEYLFSQPVLHENIYRYVSIAAPYLELIEDFTMEETVHFHSRFKSFIADYTNESIIEKTELSGARHKALKYFSSGMKQRVRLALAILSNTPVLLLDEPTMNLDKNGIEWYKNLITQYAENRIVIVCSNQLTYEYDFCSEHLNIQDYK